MDVDKLRQKAKAAGIKSWHLKKPKSLEKELAELEEAPIDKEDKQPKQPKDKIKANPKATKEHQMSLQVVVSKIDLAFFKNIGFKPDWLIDLANKYGFTKFQYMAKFKAFRCFIGEKNVDWIDVNDLSLLNGGVKITEIRSKHQPLPASRQVIKLPWRDSTKLKINDPSMK